MNYEAEYLPGLERFVRDEVKALGKRLQDTMDSPREDGLIFRYEGRQTDLLQLRTPTAVYTLLTFPIPRPKALLGHQHLTSLLQEIERTRSLHSPERFKTFTISAAGSNSTVFQRIEDELSIATGLAFEPDGGDLFLRVRPSLIDRSGWDVLVRLSPRPLGTRTWRVCDMPGALNGTIAASMVALSAPRARDQVLNIGCGSGTLLIERLNAAPAGRVVGIDYDWEALECARQNIEAARLSTPPEVTLMDATALDYPADSFDVILADLPWGALVGSPEENERLYPALLREAARVAKPGARFVAITHAISLLEALLRSDEHWTIRETLKVFQGGLHPRMYLLERKP